MRSDKISAGGLAGYIITGHSGTGVVGVVTAYAWSIQRKDARWMPPRGWHSCFPWVIFVGVEREGWLGMGKDGRGGRRGLGGSVFVPWPWNIIRASGGRTEMADRNGAPTMLVY